MLSWSSNFPHFMLPKFITMFTVHRWAILWARWIQTTHFKCSHANMRKKPYRPIHVSYFFFLGTRQPQDYCWSSIAPMRTEITVGTVANNIKTTAGTYYCNSMDQVTVSALLQVWTKVIVGATGVTINQGHCWITLVQWPQMTVAFDCPVVNAHDEWSQPLKFQCTQKYTFPTS
jgi:hypothetical protein